MALRVMVSGRYRHPEFGIVAVKVHGSTQHVKARWRGNVLTVTVPPRYPEADYEDFMERFRDAILKAKPREEFFVGRVIDAPLIDITIAAKEMRNGNAALTRLASNPLRGKKINYTVWLDTKLAADKIGTPELQEHIRSMVARAATDATRHLIVPRACELARMHGVNVSKFEVRDTRTRLGSCSSRGNISLASRLIYLPQELSDYVICHELAHRTHMDHSADFHALVDRYCGGTEARCIAELREFKWPV